MIVTPIHEWNNKNLLLYERSSHWTPEIHMTGILILRHVVWNSIQTPQLQLYLTFGQFTFKIQSLSSTNQGLHIQQEQHKSKHQQHTSSTKIKQIII